MPQCRIRFKVGNDELELEGDQKFIGKYLDKFMGRFPGPNLISVDKHQTKDLPKQILHAATSGKVPAPAEFLRQKNPDGGTERLLVLAKYLEDFRSMPDFGMKELNKLAREAKIKDVHSQYFSYAVKQGYLRTVGKGKYSLTLSGEDAVLGMPKAQTK